MERWPFLRRPASGAIQPQEKESDKNEKDGGAKTDDGDALSVTGPPSLANIGRILAGHGNGSSGRCSGYRG